MGNEEMKNNNPQICARNIYDTQRFPFGGCLSVNGKRRCAGCNTFDRVLLAFIFQGFRTGDKVKSLTLFRDHSTFLPPYNYKR